MLPENKQKVNIISYYTFRHLDNDSDENVSYKKLGFKTRTETHQSIAKQFNVKQSYVKNMEDSYDAIHNNHRSGWHQRDLRPAQQEIVNKFKDMSENELFEIVQSLINNNAKVALETLKEKTKKDDWGEATNDDLNELHIFARRIRKGQPKFRKNLPKKYNQKCIITNCPIKEVLEAAHILRHSISGINDSSNGMLLRSDIHSLFDTDKIKINPQNYIIKVDSSLKDSEYRQFKGKKIKKDINGEYPSKRYLKIKYKGS